MDSEIINKVYQEDCKITMSRMPDNFIDLTVTSPPYDNLRDYKGFTFDFEGIAKGLFRITKLGGVVVWIVGDETINGSESGNSFKQALYFKELGFNLHDTMIYEKESPRYPEINRYPQIFEYMFILSKGKIKTFNLIRDRKNRTPGKVTHQYSNKDKDGTIHRRKVDIVHSKFGVRSNIWKESQGYICGTTDKFAFEHPATFPEKLAESHIRSWSNPGDLIYDPMAGSGTTIKMAILHQRNWIASEISKEYCIIIEKRIKVAKSKPNPFWID